MKMHAIIEQKRQQKKYNQIHKVKQNLYIISHLNLSLMTEKTKTIEREIEMET